MSRTPITRFTEVIFIYRPGVINFVDSSVFFKKTPSFSISLDYAIVCCTLESAQGEIATLRARVAKLTKTNEDLAEELAALNYQGPITGVPDELITVIFSSMTLFERIQSQGYFPPPPYIYIAFFYSDAKFIFFPPGSASVGTSSTATTRRA